MRPCRYLRLNAASPIILRKSGGSRCGAPRRTHARDASLNAPIRDDGEPGEWQDWLVDNLPNQEAILAEHKEFDHRRHALNGAMGVLNDRERRIFEARRLAEEPMTLADLAAEFGVSRERVRQIEVRAFGKVQKAVKNRIAALESLAALPKEKIDG